MNRDAERKMVLALIAVHRAYADEAQEKEANPDTKEAMKRSWMIGITSMLTDVLRNVVVAMEKSGGLADCTEEEFEHLVSVAVLEIKKEWHTSRVGVMTENA
jgi:hypothetical protein